MVVAAVVAFCVLILILAFVFPRLSRHPQRGGQRALGVGGRGAGMAPGKLGGWLSKPFHSGSRMVGKSGSTGRRGRGKLPL